MFAAASVGLSAGASGAAVIWAPGSGGSTAWETAGNWAGNVAPTSSTDALFNSSSAYLFQPKVSLADSTLGLIFGNSTGVGSTTTVTIASNGTAGSLSIGTDGINMYNGSGAVTISTPISFALPSTITANSTAAFNISGSISGPSTATLTKSGTSQLILAGSSSFSGGINLGAGWISVSNTNALGSGTLNVGSGAMSATSVGSGNVPFFNVSGSTAFTVPNNIILPSPGSTEVYSLQKTGGSVLLTGTLSGGNSNMTLELNSGTSGDNTTSFEFNASSPSLTGIVRVNRGLIILDNANAIGSAALQLQTNASATTGNLVLNGSYTLPNSLTITTASDSVSVAGTNNSTLSGVLTSGVAWVKLGTGTLTLTGTNAITSTTTISAGTLQIGNGGTSGVVSASNNGAVTDNATFAFNLSTGTTYAGVISGTGSLSQLGGGTTILTAANTYTGGTTISAGTLQIGNGSTGSIAGNVTDNASLVFNEPGTVSFGGSIGGNGTVTQTGTGIVALNGNDSYTGVTNVKSGTLRFAGGTSQSSPVNVSGGALLSIANGGSTSSVSGTSLSFLSGSTTWNLAAGSTWTPTTPLMTLSGGLSTNGSTTINLVSPVLLSSGTYDLATFSGSIGGGGSFSLAPLPGHEVGVLNVAAGLLSVTISSDFPKWTGAVNGVWDINSTPNWQLVNAGTSTTYLEGDQVLFDDSATGTTSITLGTTVNPLSIIFNNNTLPYTISGGGGINGSGFVLVQGTAPVILATANTYTGGTTIAAGAQLQIGNGTAGSIVGNVVNNGSLTLVAASTGQTLAGAISGSGSITINGSNLVSLTGINTFTGGVNLSGGSVSISNPSGLGTGPFNVGTGAVNATSVSSGNAAFFTVANTAAFTFANNISLPSPVTPLVYTLQKNSGSSTTGTNLLLTGNMSGGNSNMTLELNSNISGDYSTSFEFNSSNPSMTGIVRLNRGAIILDNANAIGTAQLVMQSNPNSTIGNLDLNGSFTFANPVSMGATASNTIGVPGTNNATLSGPFTTAVAWTKLGTGTLTLAGTNAITAATTITAGTLQIGNGGTSGTLGNANVTNSGVLAFNHSDNVVYSGVISGTGTLVQAGTGMLSLAGNNTFTGPTLVNSGTLQLLAGTTQASAINVSGGATLAVTNTGPTSTATVGGLTLGSGNTTLNFIAGSGWSTSTPLLTLSGSLTNNGTATINLASGTPLNVGVDYPLVQYVGTAGGTGSYVVGSVPGRGTATITNTLGILGITITSTDITRWTGAVTNNWDINTSQNWQLVNAGTATTYMEADTVLFDDSASVNNISLNTIVHPGSVLFNNNSSTYTLSGTGSISGTTNLTMEGTATTILLNSNSYTGGTTITSGTLQIGNGGTAGSISGSVSPIGNGTIAFNRSDVVIFPGAITGTGFINQTGAGTTIFTGAVNVSGGLVVSAGAAQIGNGGTTGTLAGPTTNNGTLIFNRSNASTYTGSITGTGTVIQAGVGTTTLGGSASSYSGGTLIQSGGIAISNVSALGSGPVMVGVGANSNTTYVSAEPNFLDLSPLANGSATFANNIVLPAGTFAGIPYDPNNNSYYAIQMNGTSTTNVTTLSGVISGGGPDTILYLNNNTGGNYLSTWSITNSNNTFVGAIRLNRGSLSISSDGALGPDTNPVYIFDNADAALEFQYSGNFGHPLGDGQTVAVLNTETNNINMTGVISGTTGFIIQGDGEITFSAANTVQGIIDLQGPNVLNLNNPSALGAATFQMDQFQGVYNPTIDNTSGEPITLTTNNAQIWNSDFTFTGTNSLNLGTGNVTMNGGSGRTITVAANTLTIGGSISDGGNNYSLNLNGPGTLVLSGSNTYTGGTSVNSGTLVLAGSNSLPTNTALSVSSGATAILANHGSGAITIVVASALNNSGTIDMTNNAMVIHNGSISTLFGEVAQGFNGGAWNGSIGGSAAILSSLAAADTTHLTAVGIATGLTSFEGSAVAATDVLIKYTYYGDANLDGKVDGSDYSLIDYAYIADQTSPGSLTGWSNGDFNYDGVIDGSDYTLIDNAFNSQGAALAAAIAQPTAQISDSPQTSAVPEPAALGILGITAAGLLGRRRRR